ncbi:uncharacterized protein LOC127248219 [Andrographis paniculata]|uniref:uncharacterized protein LOC127248219 n=1 Tax=Andrographis paniculata TaxID=175694 RepID=UPI0021E6EC05|nr:uncharacterized protein LOC127248219 [Andrographis paniculata]
MDSREEESEHENEAPSFWTAERQRADARRRRRMRLRLLEREQLKRFHARFRMRRELFTRILSDMCSNNRYFTQKPDCTNRLRHSPLQKVMAAIRVHGYGCCFDSADEVIKIGGSSIRWATMEFCETIVRVYKEQYLRDPTPDDISRLLSENKARGFLGMIDSLDCMH